MEEGWLAPAFFVAGRPESGVCCKAKRDDVASSWMFAALFRFLTWFNWRYAGSWMIQLGR
jgi:hypothetical protein